MGSISTFLYALVFLVLVSCQKEIDWGLGSSSPDKLLIKILSKTGMDSTIITYAYNSNKQLIQEKTTGVQGSTSLDNDLKIYRTASGVIDRTVQVAAGLVAAGIDSIVTRYFYNAATARYIYSVFNISISGNAVKDSVVYTYDASGKIVMDETFLKAGILPAVLNLKNQYSYSADGLNLLSVVQSAPTLPGGPVSPSSTQTFSYDNKKAPLVTKQEAILLLRTGLFSTQNALKATLTNTVDPSANYNLDMTYRYNTSNKPDSSFSTRTPGGAVTVSKYFYQ